MNRFSVTEVELLELAIRLPRLHTPSSTETPATMDGIAQLAYAWADAMLKERAK